MCDMVSVKVGIKIGWSLRYGSFMVKATKLNFFQFQLEENSALEMRDCFQPKWNQKTLRVTKRTSQGISPKIAENVAV